MIAEKTSKRRVAYGLPPNMEAFLDACQEIQSLLSKGIRPDGSYKPETILSLLRFKRINVTALAATSGKGYSETYFRQVISRECKDVTVENVIADSLGIKGERINRMWGRRMLCEVGCAG
ncbi:MAG: hypothetical protein FWG02_09885 [Holophagaceae bacterium]|nr:hypothetical protein [Holophagaceae bacterium]